MHRQEHNMQKFTLFYREMTSVFYLFLAFTCMCVYVFIVHFLFSACSVNNNNNNNHLTAVCPGQPGQAGTRRNIHPLTPILVNALPLSPFSICNGPWHPLYSAYVLDSPLEQPLSKCSLVFHCTTTVLYNLPLIIKDMSLLVSSGTNCLNLFQPILILASTAASASPSTLNMSPR